MSYEMEHEFKGVFGTGALHRDIQYDVRHLFSVCAGQEPGFIPGLSQNRILGPDFVRNGYGFSYCFHKRR